MENTPSMIYNYNDFISYIMNYDILEAVNMYIESLQNLKNVDDCSLLVEET